MGVLFNELLSNTAELCTIGEAALNGAVSDKGEKDQLSGFLPTAKRSWARYIGEMKEKHESLKQAILHAKTFEGNKEVNQRLAYFRTLPRRLSEGGDPVWSVYYPEIRELKSQIAIQLDKIDEKYKLGAEAW